MLSAQDAIRLASEVSPEKKVESLLGKKTQVAIDNAVMQAINKAKQKVEIVLDDRVCYEADKDIRKALELLGFADVQVCSDSPSYGEDYRGSTSISFKIPKE